MTSCARIPLLNEKETGLGWTLPVEVCPYQDGNPERVWGFLTISSALVFHMVSIVGLRLSLDRTYHPTWPDT